MIGSDGDLPQLFDVYRWMAWAIGPTILAFAVLAGLRLRRLWRGERRASDGIARTNTFGGSLPAELRLAVSAGGSRPAHETLGEKFLRPTLGLRLVSLVLPALALIYLAQAHQMPGLIDDGFTRTIEWGLGGLMLYSILYINTYQLRYDSYRFAHRGPAFTTREIVWKDVLSIRDDGAYFYVIRDINGGKASVPKYLTGIEDFLTVVQTQIARNDTL